MLDFIVPCILLFYSVGLIQKIDVNIDSVKNLLQVFNRFDLDLLVWFPSLIAFFCMYSF